MNIRVKGKYRNGTKHTSTNWPQICADHEEEFPLIHECARGTFNISMTAVSEYMPPDDSEYRTRAKKRGESVKRYEHGNHLSPRAMVTEINGQKVEAWIYRGGNPEPRILELISRQSLAEDLNLQNEDEITVVIKEFEEGATGMPSPPPNIPGKTVKKNSGQFVGSEP